MSSMRFFGGKQSKGGRGLSVAAVLGLCLGVGIARADSPITMAPPLPVSSMPGDTPNNASQDSVFNWHEVPQGQKVTIVRAVFDQSGYQLFDNVGETIVVPFTNHNLYVMKFGQSQDDQMHFVNDGNEPVLYVPRNGYLENAAASGGKWYPFTHHAPPAQPVYLGIAPSWSDYTDMGWYPDMAYYGGYYCNEPFDSGVTLVPTYGLFVTIGDNDYYGWADYDQYCEDHPAPFRENFGDNNGYHWDNQSNWDGQRFEGGGQPFHQSDARQGWAHRSFSNDRSFSGTPVFGGSRPDFGPARSFNNARVFRGGQDSNSARSFNNHVNNQVFSPPPPPNFGSRRFGDIPRAFSAPPSFGGGGGGGRNFSSARSSGGGGFSGGGGRPSGGGGGGGGGFTGRGHRR